MNIYYYQDEPNERYGISSHWVGFRPGDLYCGTKRNAVGFNDWYVFKAHRTNDLPNKKERENDRWLAIDGPMHRDTHGNLWVLDRDNNTWACIETRVTPANYGNW